MTSPAAQSTVVFIHGAGQDRRIWLFFSRWFTQHGYTVLAMDLPGHGESAEPPLASIEAMAQWLVDRLDAAHVQVATLIGHSMGALVALECAASHPEHVTQVALIGIAAPMAVADDLLDAALHEPVRAEAMIRAWSQGNCGEAPPPTPSAAAGVLHADLLACKTYTQGQRAAELAQCPALLIIGEADRMTSPRNAQRLAARFKSARSLTLPDCGHAMLTESPDAILDALREFVASRN